MSASPGLSLRCLFLDAISMDSPRGNNRSSTVRSIYRNFPQFMKIQRFGARSEIDGGIGNRVHPSDGQIRNSIEVYRKTEFLALDRKIDNYCAVVQFCVNPDPARIRIIHFMNGQELLGHPEGLGLNLFYCFL